MNEIYTIDDINGIISIDGIYNINGIDVINIINNILSVGNININNIIDTINLSLLASMTSLLVLNCHHRHIICIYNITNDT